MMMQNLRGAIAESQVDMERRYSLLPQAALLVFGGTIGRSTTAKDKIALLLTASDKQSVISTVTRACRGKCTFKAGVDYSYAAVGVILDNLQKPFLLDGVPMDHASK